MTVLSKLRKFVGWGASTSSNLATLEAAYGGPVDYARAYGWVGALPTGLESLASQRPLIVSLKFRDAKGAVIPAADITAGKWATQLAAALVWFNALPKCAAGPHVLVFEHEIDAKAAAASGTVAQLNAAFDYCVKAARASAGWHDLVGCCVTGYDPTTREPQFEPDFAESDVICIDQPYTNGAPPWASGDSIAGPAVDWFTQHYPDKPILITEWGATVSPASSPTARADWVAQFAADLAGPRYANVAGVIYWDATTGSFDTRLNVAADVAAWAAAGRALKAATTPPPPPPPAVPVLASSLHALGDAMAALAASGDALNTAQAAQVAAQADYASKRAAAVAAAKAVTG